MSMTGLVEAFSVLFVVLGPIDNAAVFAILTHDYDASRRRRSALKAVCVATGVLLGFGLFGDDLLRLIEVQLSSLQIAGGILLLLTAIQMVTAAPSREEKKEKRAEADDGPGEDVAVFPMAMPLIAGPDAIVAVVMLVSKAGDTFPSQIGVFVVMLVILVLVYLGLLASGLLVRLLGKQGVDIISRILGLLLAALAVEFIIEGLASSVLFAGG